MKFAQIEPVTFQCNILRSKYGIYEDWACTTATRDVPSRTYGLTAFLKLNDNAPASSNILSIDGAREDHSGTALLLLTIKPFLEIDF